MSTNDHIFLDRLSFYGYHGVNPEERQLGQRFLVSIALFLDLEPAGRSDDLARTVNYAEVYRLARDIIEGPPVNLIETIAERITDAVLTYPQVQRVQVTIDKPWAPIKGMASGTVGVTITRSRRG